jgi:hypothetical protein
MQVFATLLKQQQVPDAKLLDYNIMASIHASRESPAALTRTGSLALVPIMVKG